MTDKSSEDIVNWDLCDERIDSLELRLEKALRLDQNSKDDRKLAALYLRLCQLLQSSFDSKQTLYLRLAEKYIATGKYPTELADSASLLSDYAGNCFRGESALKHKAVCTFFWKLLRSVVTEKFSIDPVISVEPISWTVAYGAKFEDVEKAVIDSYSEVRA